MEGTFTTRTEFEAILVEQALLMARELEAVSAAAPDRRPGARRHRAGRRPIRAGSDACGPRGRPAAATPGRERGQAALLADGWPGLLDHVGATPTEGRPAAGQAALDAMIGYFAKHTARLGYYGRLRSGRSIGSGAVEGLARRTGLRLEVSGRGRRAEHVDGMAGLVTTVDTPEWDDLWARPAA